jgi:hypothetical protein
VAVRRALLAASVLCFAASPPARADWLLLRDGSRVETRGPWEVHGAQTVFHLANGTLAAVRTAEVDLQGSERLTAEAQAPKPAPTPAPPREPVLRLTDADVGHVDEGAPGGPAAATPPAAVRPAAGAQATTPAPAVAGLEVARWSARFDVEGGRTTVRGTLRNGGTTIAYNLKMTVTPVGAGGQELSTAEATISTPGLPPGGSASFEASYPGHVEIADARFAISADLATLQPEAPAEPLATAAPSPAATPHAVG